MDYQPLSEFEDLIFPIPPALEMQASSDARMIIQNIYINLNPNHELPESNEYGHNQTVDRQNRLVDTPTNGEMNDQDTRPLDYGVMQQSPNDIFMPESRTLEEGLDNQPILTISESMQHSETPQIATIVGLKPVFLDKKTFESLQRPELRREEVLKIIFRNFRKAIRNPFVERYKNIRHLSTQETRKLLLKEFFTGKNQVYDVRYATLGQKNLDLKIDADYFHQNFEVFFKLIFTTKVNQNQFDIQESQTTTIIDKVLGNGISQENIQTFVSYKAIQMLWMGTEEGTWSYKHSPVLKEILQTLTPQERQKVYDKFEDIQPQELQLLP